MIVDRSSGFLRRSSLIYREGRGDAIDLDDDSALDCLAVKTVVIIGLLNPLLASYLWGGYTCSESFRITRI
ncbi:hypothetical protein DSM3645_28977 [Blastopirellula marina DSM 3645]|uniref:Uncharacterized protein n=1 Tax=Blastopirellula marina DSM 3645 TaxID=314230 RepID=A3ZPL7_9BACT|nr:hypothetical protein DSM3645_28977 [Blastopirellula marina DSM 3645]